MLLLLLARNKNSSKISKLILLWDLRGFYLLLRILLLMHVSFHCLISIVLATICILSSFLCFCSTVYVVLADGLFWSRLVVRVSLIRIWATTFQAVPRPDNLSTVMSARKVLYLPSFAGEVISTAVGLLRQDPPIITRQRLTSSRSRSIVQVFHTRAIFWLVV